MHRSLAKLYTVQRGILFPCCTVGRELKTKVVAIPMSPFGLISNRFAGQRFERLKSHQEVERLEAKVAGFTVGLLIF